MREALKNNIYMLSFLSKHCPAYIVIVILKALLTAISSVANVYIFKFILDALTSHYDIGFIILFIFTGAITLVAGGAIATIGAGVHQTVMTTTWDTL